MYRTVYSSRTCSNPFRKFELGKVGLNNSLLTIVNFVKRRNCRCCNFVIKNELCKNDRYLVQRNSGSRTLSWTLTKRVLKIWVIYDLSRGTLPLDHGVGKPPLWSEGTGIFNDGRIHSNRIPV